MKIIFLGTGTSVGIPTIGCNCRFVGREIATTTDAAAVYTWKRAGCTWWWIRPGFQGTGASIQDPRVDAVLFTHSHADHIFGFDDLRRFNTIQGAVIPPTVRSPRLRI